MRIDQESLSESFLTGGKPPVSDKLGFLGRWDLRRRRNFRLTRPSSFSSTWMSSFSGLEELDEEDELEEPEDFRDRESF